MFLSAGFSDKPWAKQLAHNMLPVVMASVAKLYWMQGGKACVEWIARLSPPTLPLFEKLQKFSVHGQRAILRGERLLLVCIPCSAPELWNKALACSTFSLFYSVGGIVHYWDKALAVMVIEQGVRMNRLVSVRHCQSLTFCNFALVVKGQVAHSVMMIVNKSRSTEAVLTGTPVTFL